VRRWAGRKTANNCFAARLIESSAANRSESAPNGTSPPSLLLHILRLFSESASANAAHASV
jgi:hypothetical protein